MSAMTEAVYNLVHQLGFSCCVCYAILKGRPIEGRRLSNRMFLLLGIRMLVFFLECRRLQVTSRGGGGLNPDYLLRQRRQRGRRRRPESAPH